MVKYKFAPRALGIRFAGIAADNAFVGSSSAARAIMNARQREQMISLSHPEACCMQSGLEKDMHHHTYKLVIPVDAEIVDIIPINAINPWRKLIFYRNIHTGVIGHLEIVRAHTGNGKFGFEYQPTKHHNVCKGQVVSAGTALYEPPSTLHDSEHNFGIELYTAICSLPETAEDGNLISESTVKRFKFKLVEKRRIMVKDWQEPIIIGEHNGRPIVVPEPGMKVRDDGILMVLRNIRAKMSHTGYSKKALTRINYDTDVIPQIHGSGGTVVDIKVIRGRHPTHTPLTSQLDDLADEWLCYERNILASYRSIPKSTRILDDETRSFITGLLLTAEYSQQDKAPLSLNINKSPIPPYIIELTISRDAVPTLGSKLTDRFSAKGVNVKQVPDIDMPVDQYGRRADIVVAREAGTNRNIVGRNHAQVVSDCIHTSTEMVLHEMGLEHKLGYKQAHRKATQVLKDKPLFGRVISLLMEIYGLLNHFQATALQQYQHDEEEMHLLLTDIISRGVIVGIPLDVVAAGNRGENDHALPLGPIPIIHDLMASRFYRQPTPVTYRNSEGEFVTTHDPIRIAPIYYILLDKLAFGCSATHTVSHQVRGLTALSNKDDKEIQPISRSNVTVLGNDEMIVMSAVIGPACMAKFLRDLTSTQYNAMYVNRVIQTSELYPDITAEQVPVTVNRGAQIINHVFHAAGINLTYHKD